MVGLSFPYSVDRKSCLLLSVFVSHLFPLLDHLQFCIRKDFAWGYGNRRRTLGTKFFDMLASTERSLVLESYAM